MSLSLLGKTAVVTGGGSGIGESVCLRLAKDGAHIAVFDVNVSAAEATVEKVLADGGKATAYECDVANAVQVKQQVDCLLESSSIDFLINSAGIAHIGKLENTSEDDMDRLFAVNVKGVYNLMFSVIQAMKARQYGVIINLASIASSVGIADRFAYSMTKGAVLTMTYSVARDYIDSGIRCNCISPARVHTRFVNEFLEKNYPDSKLEMFEKLSKSQPIGRMAQADEIASLVEYLCSDSAAFITGSNFPIDGGFVTLNN